MTCFRTAEGKSVRSMCKSMSEYTRFYRAMEKGATVEEAVAGMRVSIHKSHSRSPLLKLFERDLESYNKNTYSMIYNCMHRKKCSMRKALQWAARTGRITVKHHKREEYLKR